jgi:tetratricopeptide (TPR) repeat protein
MALLVVLALAGWFAGRHWWVGCQLRAAEQAVQRYEFSEALDAFERALRVWPRDAGTHLKAARAARRADRLERAEEHLALSAEYGPASEIALERALLRVQQGELAELEVPLRQLITDNHPDAPLIAEALARALMRAFRNEQARALLDDLLARAPNHPDAHYWRGTLLQLINLSAAAMRDYRDAVRLAPGKTAYCVRLAEVLVQSDQAPEALPHIEELLRRTPADPAVLLAAARCLRSLGQPGRACDHLDVLLRAHPDHAEGWAERGHVESDRGNSAEAVRCLRKAVELEPNSYPIVFALAAELRGQGNGREAQAFQERAERLKSEQSRIQEILIVVGKEGKHAALRHELGLYCLKNRDEEAAFQWFSGALRDDPSYRPAHAALADYYERKGDAGAADYHRQRAGDP